MYMPVTCQQQQIQGSYNNCGYDGNTVPRHRNQAHEQHQQQQLYVQQQQQYYHRHPGYGKPISVVGAAGASEVNHGDLTSVDHQSTTSLMFPSITNHDTPTHWKGPDDDYNCIASSDGTSLQTLYGNAGNQNNMMVTSLDGEWTEVHEFNCKDTTTMLGNQCQTPNDDYVIRRFQSTVETDIPTPVNHHQHHQKQQHQHQHQHQQLPSMHSMTTLQQQQQEHQQGYLLQQLRIKSNPMMSNVGGSPSQSEPVMHVQGSSADRNSGMAARRRNVDSMSSVGIVNNQSQVPFDWMKKQIYPITPSSGKTRTKDKYRIVYSEQQKVELEKEFLYNPYITIQRKAELASIIGLSDRQVKIWFQNRRAKERKEKKKRRNGGGKTTLSSSSTLHFSPANAMNVTGATSVPAADPPRSLSSSATGHHHADLRTTGGVGLKLEGAAGGGIGGLHKKDCNVDMMSNKVKSESVSL